MLCAQPAENARFDFVSIRRAAERDPGCSTRISSPVQFSIHGCSVRGLISSAWGLRAWQMSLPKDAWISSIPWDVNAKSSMPVHPGDHWRMMQAVLRDRFALKVHHETRQLPVYYLSVSKRGLKLSESKPGNGCRPFDHKSPPHPPAPGEAPYCDYLSMPETKDRAGLQIIGTELSISSLIAPGLTMLLGRPVIDRTGLTGRYDIHLSFSMDSIPAFAASPIARGGDPAGWPDLFTAIRETGLDIESGKGPVDVLVVDSVQQPSQN
ncbi:MAG TPA: TIGR03435 family protein [Bryobacteraceae bacterium]|nr:TIGR03435 family protein [Bryobacteraceae bacterium]